MMYVCCSTSALDKEMAATNEGWLQGALQGQGVGRVAEWFTAKGKAVRKGRGTSEDTQRERGWCNERVKGVNSQLAR